MKPTQKQNMQSIKPIVIKCARVVKQVTVRGVLTYIFKIAEIIKINDTCFVS